MTEIELERLVTRFTGDMSGLQKTLNQATSSVTQFSSQVSATSALVLGAVGGAASSIVGTMTSAIALMANSAVSSLTQLGKTAVGLAMDLEKVTISFQTMLGGGDTGKARAQHMLEEIRQYAAATPFEQGPLRESARMLMQYGINAEKILPTIKMLGDVAQGDQQKLNGLSYAFAQMSARGHVAGDDLRQMINWGFNPLQEMARTTGRSMNELTDSMHKGQIPVKMLEDAFKSASSKGGAFFGAMEAQSKSLFGLWSTLKDDTNNVLTQIGTMLVRQLGLKEIIASLSSTIGQYTSIIVGIVRSVLEYVRPIWIEFGNVGVAAFNAIGVVATAVWNSIGVTTMSFITLFRASILTVMIAAEFAFQNIGRITATVMAIASAQSLTFFNTVTYYLTIVIPAHLKYLLQNWVAVFNAIAKNTASIMENLFLNILANFGLLVLAMQNKSMKDFKFVWIPIKAEMESVFGEMEAIPGRDISPSEFFADDLQENLKKGLGSDFSDFLGKRMKEISGTLADEIKLEFPGFAPGKIDTGLAQLNDHKKSGKQDNHPIQQAITGSVDAMQRIAEYAEGTKGRVNPAVAEGIKTNTQLAKLNDKMDRSNQLNEKMAGEPQFKFVAAGLT